MISFLDLALCKSVKPNFLLDPTEKLPSGVCYLSPAPQAVPPLVHSAKSESAIIISSVECIRKAVFAFRDLIIKYSGNIYKYALFYYIVTFL